MEPRTVDVVVVGAGAAGLAAAAWLKRKRRSVVVIEAHDRVGGRVETLRDAAFPAPIELGAEFVHGKPKSLLTVLEQNRIRIRRHEDSHWLLHAGALRRADRAFEQVSELMIESGHADRTFAAHLKDPRTVAKWPDLERELAAMFVEGYYAAPLKVAGTAAIAQMERKTSEVNAQELFRVTDGYDRVTAALGEALQEPEELWLNAVVHEVRWGPNGVAVFSRTQRDVELPPVKARRAILSVPLAVLAAKPREVGAIRFAPGLPEKVHAVQRLATGSIIKIALRFRRAFWDDPEVRARAVGRLGRFSFAHGRGLAFPTFWMPRPFTDPVLVGWTAGPAADALTGAGEDLLTLNALESLSALFGHSVPELEAMLVAVRTRDWQADPFARGGYAVLPVNGLEAQQELARPVGDRLFFAGEATHTGGFAGTVHGAIETGVRAANEVLEADRR